MTGSTLQLKALAEAQDVLRTSVEPLIGMRNALPALAQLFGSRHAAIDTQPLDGSPPRLIEILHADEVEESVRNYSAYAVDSPGARMVKAGGFSPVVRIHDHVPKEEFETTRYYQAIFRPAGWRDQLGFGLRLQEAAVSVFFPRERLFDDDEIRMAEGLQRSFCESFGVVKTDFPHDRFRHAWRLPLGASGEPFIMPLSVQKLLAAYFSPQAGEPGMLPQQLKTWVRLLQLRRDRARFSDVPRTLAVDQPQGRLHVELGSCSDGRELLCLYEEKGRHDFYRLRALRLTDREIEVLFWIAQGKADGDIAVILGMASKTASKHLENILPKLAATNRTCAAVRAVEWLADSAVEPGQIW